MARISFSLGTAMCSFNSSLYIFSFVTFFFMSDTNPEGESPIQAKPIIHDNSLQSSPGDILGFYTPQLSGNPLLIDVVGFNKMNGTSTVLNSTGQAISINPNLAILPTNTSSFNPTTGDLVCIISRENELLKYNDLSNTASNINLFPASVTAPQFLNGVLYGIDIENNGYGNGPTVDFEIVDIDIQTGLINGIAPFQFSPGGIYTFNHQLMSSATNGVDELYFVSGSHLLIITNPNPFNPSLCHIDLDPSSQSIFYGLEYKTTGKLWALRENNSIPSLDLVEIDFKNCVQNPTITPLYNLQANMRPSPGGWILNNEFYSTTLDTCDWKYYLSTLYDGMLFSSRLVEIDLVNNKHTEQINPQYLFGIELKDQSCENCTAEFTCISETDCGLVQFSSLAMGTGFFSYQWDFDDPGSGANNNSSLANPVHDFSTCGNFNVTLTIVCPDGTLLSFSKIVTITDNAPPVSSCALPFSVILDANCEYTLSTSEIDEGSSDNCQIKSISINPNPLQGCAFHNVVLTVTDWCNNTSTCSTEVQTHEDTPPIIMCPPDISFQCDTDTSPNAAGVATATDNCDPNPVISYSDLVLGMAPCDGLIIRTWEALDSCGNIASCVQQIYIRDTVAPMAICSSGINVYLGPSCLASITPALIDAGSKDNCQLQSLSVSPNSIIQCGTELVTLTATDSCGNTGTCQQNITVQDTIPPVISCPQDMSINAIFPDCSATVNNIHAGATDNCTIQSINYSISGATISNGVGDASGQVFNQGTSNVTYTAMDACGNVDTCNFNIIVACDTCSCLGFTNLSFYTSPDDAGIPVACDSSSVALPCISPDGLYSFQWTLLCSDPLCAQSYNYEIVSASGGPPIISSSAALPFISFSYSQLSGPGNYQLILSGHCNGDTCTCVINFSLMDCCDCGSFSGMMFETVKDSSSMNISCGDTLGVSCSQAADIEVNGLFLCQGSLCDPNQMINWELKDTSGAIFQNGLVQSGPGFSLSLMPSWFSIPGIYTLTFTGSCGGELCPPCILYFESDGCLPPAENCCFEWVAETEGQYSSGYDIVSDAAGNVYSIGNFSGSVDFDPGPGVLSLTSSGQTNAFILKLDATGSPVWVKQIGPGPATALSININASGDIYIGGYFRNTCDFDPGAGISNMTANNLDGFILKLDASGNFIWSRQIRGITNSPGNYNQIISIAIDPSGNVLSTGRYYGQTDFDPGPGTMVISGGNQCFVAKWDNNGNFIWAKNLEPNLNGISIGVSIDTDAFGNVYTTGSFFYSVDFDPSTAVFSMTSKGFQEIFILKLDPSGNFVWAKQIEGVPGGNNFASSIKVDPIGNIITNGTFEFTADFDPGPNTSILTVTNGRNGFVMNLDNNGDFLWAKNIGGNTSGSIHMSRSLAFDATGNIYTCGTFYGLNDFDPGPGIFYGSSVNNAGNSFILKLDQLGEFKWAKFLEGPGTCNANSLAISPSSDVFSTGQFLGMIDFDPGPSVLNLHTGILSNNFVHKISTCPSRSCIDPYPVIRLTPCRYRFQVEVDNDCIALIHLKLDTNIFINWTVNDESGLIAEATGPTEIILSHEDGFLPTGKSISIVFELAEEGINPNLSVSWENTCDPVTECSTSFLLEACPSECQCGRFTDMYLRGPQGLASLPISCGGQPIDILCPEPGTSYVLSGRFQCEGEMCSPDTDIPWELVGPFGNTLASGTTQSMPWFTLNLSSSLLQQAGEYRLLLFPNCGTSQCACIIEFNVREECPDPCPCTSESHEELDANVNQGFSVIKPYDSCRACFSPNALSDCENIEWHLDSPDGALLGTSKGNATFCYNFPAAGTYPVVMLVERLLPDGVVCDQFSITQTITVSCTSDPECSSSIFPNPGFNENSVQGILGVDGFTENWIRLVGTPSVIEGSITSRDRWTIELKGNLDSFDILTTLEPICLDEPEGLIKLRTRWGDPHVNEKDGTKWDFKKIMFKGNAFDPNDCNGLDCLELASIEFSPDDKGWMDIQIPYDLGDWTVEDPCGGYLVRPAVLVKTPYSFEQGGESSRVTVQLDNICFEKLSVGIEEQHLNNDFEIIPNPNNAIFVLRSKELIQDNINIQIVDMHGRLIYDHKYDTGLKDYEINLINITSGIYFVKVYNKTKLQWSGKMVIQK